MNSKVLLTVSLHLFCVFLIIRIFSSVAPCSVNSIITLFTTLLIGYYTWSFTKQKWLSDRIEPRGKAVFITGCDSGFGKATARRLDSKGFHVFAGCLFPTGPGALELKDKCSETLEIVELDVTKETSVNAALELVKDHLGSSELWALINNAGVLKGSSFAISNFQDFQDCIEVNVYGPIRMVKAFLPLLKQTQGRVINLTSTAGRFCIPYITPYTISKYAEAGFNDSLRQELEPWKISVISIEPEIYKTGLISKETLKESLCSYKENLAESTEVGDEEQHLKDVETLSTLTFDIASPDIDTVVDEIESAVLSEYPDVIYRARRNIVFRSILFFMEIVPGEILDVLIKILGNEKIFTLIRTILKPWL